MIARRICCVLPKTIQGFCEVGCIYRESNFRHLACPKLRKTPGCIAPCKQEECTCGPKKEFQILPLTKKEQNEVFALQKEDTSRVQMLM